MSRIFSRLLLAAGLLALAGPVLALGLGRLEVRSQQGEPLLAEIPIVSSDPAELRQLQARLASPETFARIGLEPPRGVVSDLQFNVALDASGRPVIRVTSAAPVTEGSLTFLVEVDWGQGRLVREYAALIAVPETVAAPAQPTIQAPVATSAPSIVRPPVAPATPPSAPASTPEPAPPAESPADSDAIATAPPAQPAPSPVVAAPAPGGVAGIEPDAAMPAVRAGQTLSAIAAPLADTADISINQAMLLLLRTNPDAFIGGNLNLLREGAVLRVPARDAWDQFSAAEANAVVREQVGQWREMRRPAPQPAPPADAEPEVASTAASAPAAAPRTASARLEITPPASDSQPADSQSGIAAGAGGDMLRQELQQANETVAARTAEIDELKARLDDLEQLQQQQQQLIQLKDAELAAAQQRMEASNQQQATASAPFPWIWLGLALLVVAALAFLLGRRGRTTTASRAFDSAALAAGMPNAQPAATGATASSVPPAFARDTSEPAPAIAPAPAVASVTSGPTWHAPDASQDASDASTPASPLRDAPVTDTPVELDTGDAVEVPIGVERIELARAYIDLGDTATARSLLEEVVEGDDLTAAAQAAQLLRTLD